jgi:ribonuclease-3
MVEGRSIGTGAGRSKKHAEQEAARVALEGLDGEHAA